MLLALQPATFALIVSFLSHKQSEKKNVCPKICSTYRGSVKTHVKMTDGHSCRSPDVLWVQGGHLTKQTFLELAQGSCFFSPGKCFAGTPGNLSAVADWSDRMDTVGNSQSSLNQRRFMSAPQEELQPVKPTDQGWKQLVTAGDGTFHELIHVYDMLFMFSLLPYCFKPTVLMFLSLHLFSCRIAKSFLGIKE